MQKVAEILAGKGTEVWTVSPEAPVREVLLELVTRDVGALPVVAGDKLCGIFSERDCVRKAAREGRLDLDEQVSAVMTTQVYYISSDYSVEECMALMTEKRIRHLPVLEGEKLVGILTIGDVVKWINADQQFIIEKLEKFIRGDYPA